MKAWNHRHPNILLVWWVFVWVIYALSAFDAAVTGDIFWLVLYVITVLWADSRCRYWYAKTGEQS